MENQENPIGEVENVASQLKGIEQNNKEKLTSKIDFIKWIINTVVIGLLTFFFTWVLQERKQGIEELQVYNEYIELITKVDGLAERRLLAEFFSTVTVSKPLRTGWKEYYDTINKQYIKEINKQKTIIETEDVRNDYGAQKVRVAEAILEDLENKGKFEPIISEKSEPIIYFQITKKTLRKKSDKLISKLKFRNFNAIGSEYVNVDLINNEIRYFKQSDYQNVLKIQNILTESGISITIVPLLKTGYIVKDGTIEIWLTK